MLRYRDTMLNAIARKCYQWNSRGLDMQTGDVINDVLSTVLLNLCQNDCRVLRDFQNRDNEIKFKAWLAIICQRSAGRYLKNRLFRHDRIVMEEKEDQRSESPGEFLPGYQMSSVSQSTRWELYEETVARLSRGKRRNLQRDIHLFLIYTWADFDLDMIDALPCLKGMGGRTVDNVVHRLRKILRESSAEMR